MPENTTVTLENVQLMYRNFAGRPTQYTPDGGKRDFCIVLPDDIADQFEREGWNVKTSKVREAGDEPFHYLTVAVSYKIRPPRILLLGSKGGRTPIPEDMIELADYVDVDYADVTFRGRTWMDGGRERIKAYLQTAYIRVHEDPLDLKYADEPLVELPGSAQKALRGRDVLELEQTPSYDFEGEVV